LKRAAARLFVAAAISAVMPSGLARAGAPPPKLLVIGDSIQAGTGLPPGTKLAVDWIREGGIRVLNVSRPGAGVTLPHSMPPLAFKGTCFAQLPDFLEPDAIVIALGTNDWRHEKTLEEFLDAYAQLLDTLPRGVPVICVSPTWREDEWKPNKSGFSLDSFRAGLWLLCSERGFAYLEGSAAIPHVPIFYDDLVHPNALGHSFLGRFLYEELRGRLGWDP
jgi:lysophospholipase L1-like esterase